jgi:hypothetical protein
MSKKQNAEEDYITTPISVLSYITDLERQLEEAREDRDYLARGIQVRDKMIKSLQDECVKLHLQLPIKPSIIQLKEQG